MLFDLATRKERFLFKGHTSRISSLVFSSDGKRMVTGSADGTVKMWDPNSGLALATFQAGAGKIFSVAISPDSQIIAVACQDRTVKLWRAATPAQVAQDLSKGL